MNLRGRKSASEASCGRGGGELSEGTDGRPSGCHRSARNGGVLRENARARVRECAYAFRNRICAGVRNARVYAGASCGASAAQGQRKQKKRHACACRVERSACAGQTRSMARVFASSTPVLATATTVSPLCTRLKYPAIFVACSAASCVTLGWSAARMG